MINLSPATVERYLIALRLRALYNENEERDYHGRWAPSGGGGKPATDREKHAAKVAQALKSHKPMTKDVRSVATQGENRVIEMIKGTKTDDNAPMDVISKNVGDGKTHAVEVKTMVPGGNTNDKITMHKDSLARKEKFVRKTGMRGHTVVLDARRTSVARAPVYYRRGLGSFRLHTMTPVRNEAHLRELMRAK